MENNRILPVSKLCDLIIDVGGVVFDSPYLMNLVAIRDLSNPDSWNDQLYYFYYDDTKNPHEYHITEFTTDPGMKFLKSPSNPKGTAIICEGWHRRLWKLGLHRGYEALQQYSPVNVYRDSNKDGKFDLDPNTITSGMYGINLHRANVNSIAEKVNSHSAGCCVVRRYSDWMKFLEAVHRCYNHGQRYWSLALINKEDIN